MLWEVERRVFPPVGIENGGCVTAKQGNLVGQLAPLVQGDDGKSTAARGVPVDGEVRGVHLRHGISIGAQGSRGRAVGGGR